MTKVTFYFDRNIGKKLPQALRHLNPPFEVKWHNEEKFPHDMPDDEWLAIVGPGKGTVITQNWKYHLREPELRAIKDHNVKCFYLPASGASKWDLYCLFVKSHKRIIEFSKSHSAPFVFDLKSNGHIKTVQF